MRQRLLVGLVVGTCTWLAVAAFAAPPGGRIEGRVTTSDGAGLSGVRVGVAETAATTLSDAHGNFGFAVAPGTYTLTFRAGELSDTVPGVEVPLDGVARLEHTLDWDLTPAETATVFSAAGPPQRPAAAAAAVTVVAGAESERAAAHAQPPRLLTSAPGTEVTESGLYDFNFNTRGLNGSLNRRVKVLIDGRDPAVPFFGSQEWAAFPFALDELAQLELVRGPSAAFAGGNAAGGVLNLITRRPRDSRGGRLRLSGGELDTANADLRWAGALGEKSFLKLAGGARHSGEFTVSRHGRAEYSVPCTTPGQSDCLPQEAVSPDPADDDEIYFGSARLDRYLGHGGLLSLETGLADVSGPVVRTDLGRLQLVDVAHHWLRFQLGIGRWSFLATYKNRNADRQRALATGDNLTLDGKNWKGELRGNWTLHGDRALLVAGISHEDERIDSTDENGPLRPALLNPLNQQTLLYEAVESQADACFAQLDWPLNERLTLMLAARYDDSTLYDPQWTPRGALVFAINPSHTLRFTYHEAFQVPNYSELFLQSDLEAPINLAELESICALDGVACGFDIDFIPGEDPTLDATPDTRVLALGNRDLELEETRSWELGYSASLGRKLTIAVDLHHSKHENLIAGLLPQLGTSLGRVNPAFGPYVPPHGLSAAGWVQLRARLQQILGPRFAFLSNNLDGTPILAMASYANFGTVDADGLDLALSWYPARGWTLAFSYSWLDFEVDRSPAGLDHLLLANAPENQVRLMLGWAGRRWNASARYRWVDEFRWVSLPFEGDVDSYATVDVIANLHLGDHWNLGLNVVNLLDDEHWESFGGDLIGRRALASVSYGW